MKLRILGVEELKFVQIQIVENNAEFEKLSGNAKYLESPVFSIFKICFELSNVDFQYLSTNLFSNDQIVSLRNHLMTQLTRISVIQNPEDLQTFILIQISGIEFMDELKTLYKDWHISWESIRDKLVAINRDLIEIADICIDEDKLLYVKAY